MLGQHPLLQQQEQQQLSPHPPPHPIAHYPTAHRRPPPPPPPRVVLEPLKVEHVALVVARRLPHAHVQLVLEAPAAVVGDGRPRVLRAGALAAQPAERLVRGSRRGSRVGWM